jgi:cell wall-associated NlpC family hydrolase
VSALDKRLNAYRPDLADETLRSSVSATAYVSGSAHQVSVPVARVLSEPMSYATQLTQAVFGEIVDVFETREGWAWIKLSRDGYVGYTETINLNAQVKTSTHHVTVASTICFPRANLKTQPITVLPCQSHLSVTGPSGDYLALATGGFVYAQHISPVGNFAKDFVSIAEKFVDVPYLWGGRTALGLDCSGLVQIALQSAGIEAQRDADMQEQQCGEAVNPIDLNGLRRGDLVFWNGHVGIMCDSTMLLHANGYHMMVVKEPLTAAIRRIATTGSAITSVKRFQ